MTSGPKTQQICGVCHLSGGQVAIPLGQVRLFFQESLVRGVKWWKPHKTWLFLPLVTFEISSHRGTSGPGGTTGPPIEDKKRTTMAQTRGSTGVFPVVRVCKNKKSVQEWGILTPRYQGEAAGAPGFSTLVHVWISSRGSAPGCERMCYPWTIC